MTVRRTTAGTALATLLVASVVAGAAPVEAATCAGRNETQRQTDRRFFDGADAVFAGTVRRVVPADGPGAKRPRSIYVFAVERAYKGRLGPVERVLAHRALSIDGGRVLVFAYRTSRGGADVENGPKPRWTAFACGGTRDLGADEKPPFGKGRPVPAAS